MADEFPIILLAKLFYTFVYRFNCVAVIIIPCCKQRLSKWLVSNKLTLNATKTEFMLIGSRQRLSTLSDTLELSIDNVPIEQVSSVKLLGIYVDENLTWHSHIDKLCKKIASAIGAIKRVKPFVPQSTLLSIYNSLVQPHFDYCSLVWGNSGKTSSNKLQKLQNRAARGVSVKCGPGGGGWRMADGGWRMADGGWRMADGGWRMADGGWRMADGGWRMADGG